MDIDLNKYTMQELYELNAMVVKQIRAKQKSEAREKSIEFKIGQAVYFIARTGERVEGKLARFLPKNLEIHVTDPLTLRLTKWKVSPGLVKAVEPSEKSDVIDDLGGDTVEDFGKHTSASDKPKTRSMEAW